MMLITSTLSQYDFRSCHSTLDAESRLLITLDSCLRRNDTKQSWRDRVLVSDCNSRQHGVVLLNH
jgi:hypothetical protein